MKTGKELPEPDMKGAHGNVTEENGPAGLVVEYDLGYLPPPCKPLSGDGVVGPGEVGEVIRDHGGDEIVCQQ